MRRLEARRVIVLYSFLTIVGIAIWLTVFYTGLEHLERLDWLPPSWSLPIGGILYIAWVLGWLFEVPYLIGSEIFHW